MTYQQRYEALYKIRADLRDTQKLLGYLEQPSAVDYLERLIESLSESISEMGDGV